MTGNCQAGLFGIRLLGMPRQFQGHIIVWAIVEIERNRRANFTVGLRMSRIEIKGKQQYFSISALRQICALDPVVDKAWSFPFNLSSDHNDRRPWPCIGATEQLTLVSKIIVSTPIVMSRSISQHEQLCTCMHLRSCVPGATRLRHRVTLNAVWCSWSVRKYGQYSSKKTSEVGGYG